MALNFADVATRPVAEIEAAPLPPVGVYRWKIMKLPEARTTPDEKWDILNINCRAQEAVDVEDIADYPGKVEGIMLSKTFMFDKNDEAAFANTLNNLRTFLEKHVKCADEGMSLGQALNAAVQQEFLGNVGWREDKREEGTFQASITKTAPLD